ncbi:MAG TPA: HEAT repeat domain-containing protein [Acidobacteriaceae bacterium]|nr:HEAT repeat domain-containing protein [Acidobacteriaceae bacterium]
MKKTSSALPRLAVLSAAAILSAAAATLAAQVSPLAPRWLAGTPPPPVETFASGLERHNIPLTEPALIDALQNPDGDVRSLAAAQLAAMDDHAALPQINHAIGNEHDPQVRVNLAGAATWLGSRYALEQLVQLCQDINTPATTRLDAARYVSHKGVADCYSSVEQIEHTDQDPAMRVLAISAAANYRGQEGSAVLLAGQALQDVEPTVRTAGADALHGLRAVNSIQELEQALHVESDETARGHMREAIQSLRADQATHR